VGGETAGDFGTAGVEGALEERDGRATQRGRGLIGERSELLGERPPIDDRAPVGEVFEAAGHG
jgi:hypothetical protein